MQFRGAIFDVDGVLIDSPHQRAWRESLQQLMLGPWRVIAPQTRYTPEGFTTEIYQRLLAGKPREAGARAILAYFAIPDPDEQRLHTYCDAKQAYLLSLATRGEFVAFDDALRFLLKLRAAGVKLGVASSSKNANLFLSRVPVPEASTRRGVRVPELSTLSAPPPAAPLLIDLFDANVCGRDFGRGKPDPSIFLVAADELGLPPDECVVIEDAPSGVRAAKAGGMACIGVARLHDDELLRAAGADIIVANLNQLEIEALFGLARTV